MDSTSSDVVESSPEETDDFTYKSKNGRWYRSYEMMANANKVHNEQFIASLGLAKVQTKKTSTKKIVRKKQKRSEPPRRSSRLRGQTQPEFSQGLDDYTTSLVDGLQKHPSPNKKQKTSHHQQTHRSPTTTTTTGSGRKYETLTPTQLLEMKTYFEQNSDKIDNHVLCEEMCDFLIQVPHGHYKKRVVSIENATSTMTQVRKLIFNRGISYHHWPTNVAFYWWKEDIEENKKDDLKPNHCRVHIMTRDLGEIYDRAQTMEDWYGRDLGNGW
jgi:hypothetical protein